MVPADSDRASPIPPYSGYRYSNHSYAYRTVTFYGSIFQKILLQMIVHVRPYNLHNGFPLGFGLFRVRSPLLAESLFVFFSSSYLDVSVLWVVFPLTWDSMPSAWKVSLFGNPRIKACMQLPAAYRSLPRPSSSPRAKASTMRPYSLPIL